MGMYFGSAKEKAAYEAEMKLRTDQEDALIEDGHRKLAAKIVMSIVDKIITEIVRPGPVPEERECYEMAGEIRAIVPALETIAVKIIEKTAKEN